MSWAINTLLVAKMNDSQISDCLTEIKEVAMIRARGLSRRDYLRLRRSAEGLPRMSRAALNSAFDASERPAPLTFLNSGARIAYG